MTRLYGAEEDVPPQNAGTLIAFYDQHDNGKLAAVCATYNPRLYVQWKDVNGKVSLPRVRYWAFVRDIKALLGEQHDAPLGNAE